VKIRYQIATGNISYQVSAFDPHGASNCRGRCYLPRIGSQPSTSRLSRKIQLGLQGNRPKGDTSFAVNTDPGQGWLIRVTEPCEMKPWAEVGGLIQANPTKSKVKNSSKPARSKMSRICVNLCNLWTILPPLRSLRPLRLNSPSSWVKPGQAQSRHTRVKTCAFSLRPTTLP